jgi:Mn2+/Fe2+ NRAMP family transporter
MRAHRHSAFGILHSAFVRHLPRLGPGIISGAADDDPSGIVTFSIAGARLGNSLLWFSWVSWPLMHAVQMMCARVGMQTGRGLVGALAMKLPRPVLLLAALALFLANTINIGADLAGMAEAAALVTGLSAWLYVLLFGAGIAYATVQLTYRSIARVLKWLTLALFAYVAAAAHVTSNWSAVLHDTFTISLPRGAETWQIVVALIGVTFSPYFFIWQASQEVEEKRDVRGPGAPLHGTRAEDLAARKLDVGVGTFFSRVVMFFVILTTSMTLHPCGLVVSSAADAAEALRPIAGTFAMWLYTAGILGVGFLVIPVLSTSAAYAFAELFGWRHGLDQRLGRAANFYAVILLSTVGGVVMHLTNISSVRALLWAGVINGVLAPFLLIGVLLAARGITPRWEQAGVAVAIVAMIAAGVVWIL